MAPNIGGEILIVLVLIVVLDFVSAQGEVCVWGNESLSVEGFMFPALSAIMAFPALTVSWGALEPIFGDEDENENEGLGEGRDFGWHDGDGEGER